MNGERLELVTDASVLRPGVLVVGKSCGQCGGDHRGMIIGRCDGHPMLSWRNGGPVEGWKMVPAAAHDVVWGTGFSWFSPDAVATGRIYRVVDGLESSLPTSTKKRTPRRERA